MAPSTPSVEEWWPFLSMSPVDQSLAAIFDKQGDEGLAQEANMEMQQLDNYFQKAQLFRDEGKHAEAEPLFKAALAGYERIQGGDHPYTLQCCNTYGLNLSESGRQQEAEALLRRAVDGMRSQLGTRSKQTLAAVNNLALCLRAQGRFVEAAPLFRQAMNEGELVFQSKKDDRLYLLDVKNNLALCLQDLGQNDVAESLIRTVIRTYEREHGSKPAESMKSLYFYHNLAAALDAQQKDEEAEYYYKRALTGMKQVVGVDHPATQQCVQNLVTMLEVIGRTTEAAGYKLMLRAAQS
eukprot:gnl/TRDRNA2_/TRDRNA2_184245_c0_seq1.p1 gnl/TRDRNA2_/TRDRNA2_184245_c0~~gnl/TRDRNA2_/TRDRNA2_184245_c0_seq1.p1  ORF type:complete len:309 (-),score=77.96 gnl/TRDRNA2_/TRDRNA2_184245_c0_seq1:139-1023(-)